jgi:hypothetical protein
MTRALALGLGTMTVTDKRRPPARVRRRTAATPDVRRWRPVRRRPPASE